MNKEEIVDTGCCSMPTTSPSCKLSVKQMKQTIVFGNDAPDETELVLGDNYEVKVEEGRTYVVKKQPKYPNTYKECCKVLSLGEDGRLYTKGYKAGLIQDFQKLIICRDAYWKLAGDWNPDWEDDSDKYFICYIKDKLWTSNIRDCNRFLIFPTEEMRNAFYENFKDLIEVCKDLL